MQKDGPCTVLQLSRPCSVSGIIEVKLCAFVYTSFVYSITGIYTLIGFFEGFLLLLERGQRDASFFRPGRKLRRSLD